MPDGTHEFRCTARTTSIYEQAFYNDPSPLVTGDMSADVLGKRRIAEDSIGFVWNEDGTEVEAMVVDFTTDNWQAERRALWAMLRTQEELDLKHGREPYRVPHYLEWDRSLVDWEPDLREVATLVIDELRRGLFRSGAAAS